MSDCSMNMVELNDDAFCRLNQDYGPEFGVDMQDSIRSAPDSYILYKKRWLVLGSFALISTSSAWMWITWSPIASQVARMWKVDEGAVDNLSGVYMYVYVPGSFVSLSLVVNYLGMYRGLLLGAFLNMMGALVRYTYWDNYQAVYGGTMLAALAQTFLLSAPPLIAGNWFGAEERGVATALGVLANQTGTALGLGATILVNFFMSDGSLDQMKLQGYLRAQLFAAILAFIMIFTFGADKPLTPPSKAAWLLTRQTPGCGKPMTVDQNDSELPYLADEESSLLRSNKTKVDSVGPTYVTSVLSLWKSTTNLVFIIAFGLSVGVYYTIPTFLSQLMPRAWSSRAGGWLGVFYQIAGVVGSFGCGRLVDKTQQHRAISLALLGCGFVAMSVLGLAIFADSQNKTVPNIAVSICYAAGVALSGACLAAWNTIGLDFGTALTYPADEAAVGGILECAAELLGFVWVSVGGYFVENDEPVRLAVMLGLAVATSFMAIGIIHPESKRPL